MVVLRPLHVTALTAVFVNMAFSDEDKLLMTPLPSGPFNYKHV